MWRWILLALAIAPAAARAEPGADAADCAALYRAAADVQRNNPRLGVKPATSEALEASFRRIALAHGVDEEKLRAVFGENVPGYRLLYRAVIAGDRQSTQLLDRRAQSCDRLLSSGG